MLQIKRVTTLFLVGSILLAGCASSGTIRDKNQERLFRLSKGMTKAKVLKAMGTKTTRDPWSPGLSRIIPNPYCTEMYRSNDHTFELLLYYTDRRSAVRAITDDELTPIIIIDGKLDGWGWPHWEIVIKEYDIRLPQYHRG